MKKRDKELTPIVYTMGKVASSSISTSIRHAGVTVHDIHTLEPDLLKKMTFKFLERGEFPPPHVCVSMAHRDRLIVKRKRCFYISLVRDPIARNLSAFFQNLHLKSENIRDEPNGSVLFKNFVSTYNHDIPLTWFDREFRDQLGIDIFQRPFDKQKLYSYYPSINTALFRVDCPDDVKSRVLTRILGTKIDVGRANDGSNKDYNERYSSVKGQAVFPRVFTERIYNSTFAKHFWTDDELKRLKSKWTAVEGANPGGLGAGY